jgi:hypothetical protein
MCNNAFSNNFDKKYLKMKALIILLSFLSCSTFSQEILCEWKSARKNENVELQYRWVCLGDTLKTRELRALFTVNAPSEAIIRNLNTESNFQNWSVGVKQCKNIEQTSDGWIMYSLFDIPKPFNQQDLIAKYTVEQLANTTVVMIESVPKYLPTVKNVIRINNYSGYWILESVSDNITHVKFHSTSYTKPMFPHFIQDPILQRMLIKSFETLINQSENEAIAQN